MIQKEWVDNLQLSWCFGRHSLWYQKTKDMEACFYWRWFVIKLKKGQIYATPDSSSFLSPSNYIKILRVNTRIVEYKYLINSDYNDTIRGYVSYAGVGELKKAIGYIVPETIQILLDLKWN